MSGDIHALSGAYAVDAVDDIERAMFERHLAQCGSCRAEVDSLREAGALIAETSAQAPPAALRDRVLAGIDAVRPLPPMLSASAERNRARRRLPALVAAAAALIALGAVGATIVQQDSETSSVSEAGGLESFSGKMPAGGTVTVVRSKSLNQALVTTEGLPTLPEDKTYELWLDYDGTMVKAGLMDGDASSILLEGDVANASGAGVTIEPAGGSTEPTLDGNALVVAFKQA